MSNFEDAIRAIGGLFIGGLIFITFGSALADTTLGGSLFVDFRFWGIIYILVAILLGIAFVGAIISSIIKSL